MPVERAAGGTSLIDVLDRVLDKGIVIDAWVRVSLVGIDLITVEARIVVASIDTYLKYSEAVGQVAPVSKPAIEGKGYEEVIAENAALRAQLKCRSRRAALLAVGAPRSPRLSATAPAPYTGRPARPRRASRNGPRRRRRLDRGARCACSKGSSAAPRSPTARSSRCSGSARCSASRSRSAWCGRWASTSLFVVGAYGLPASAASRFTRLARGLGQPARHRVHQPQATSSSRRRTRPPIASGRPATPFEDARVPRRAARRLRLRRGRVRPAAARRQRAPLPPELHWFTSVFSQKLDQILRQQALDRRRPQAGARALAALQHHQRGHRPDSADRHRRAAADRQRARADAVHRVGGGERRPPRRGAHEQHAAVVGAVEQGDRGDRRDAARAAARQPGRRIRPACSSCSARSPRIRGRAAASSRFCATSPTCGAPARRSRRTTARCASPRCRRAPRATA